MLQSKQLLAATLAVDEPDPTLSGITILPEKGATGSTAKAGGGAEGKGELEDSERRTSILGRRKKSSNPSSKKAAPAAAEDGQLKRGSAKRRSL